MAVPKTAALPLGYAPKLNSYNTTNQKLYSFRHYRPIFFVFIGE